MVTDYYFLLPSECEENGHPIDPDEPGVYQRCYCREFYFSPIFDKMLRSPDPSDYEMEL